MHALSSSGRSALHLASEGGSAAHAACISLLLRYGADARVTDVLGCTPAALARVHVSVCVCVCVCLLCAAVRARARVQPL